ncbi:MAG: exodeoxyribonuclease VII small subunit [Gammaproteobacteria bacterium]|nr:exodeoxyribonuclease VII small subunit [Gammaproteobacteria bacterium]
MDKELTFEEAMKELEEIVKNLEEGNLSLDDSVKKYTRGLELSKYAYDLLKTAEAKISVKEDEA